MKVGERRLEIVNLLSSASDALSGGELARRFNISRQIIVQDVSALRGTGYDIVSTGRGYVLKKSPLVERVFKVRHTSEQTEDELSCIVACGATVVDVFVWHKVYGKITAPLNIFSRLKIEQFLEGVRSGKSTELMNVTGGYHYHTVRAETKEILDEVERELNKRGYVAPEI